MDEIDNLLRQAAVRLLTLTGPGGIGKTRLVTEVARKADSDFPDGVAFVALAPLGDAALVMPTASQVLGLREVAGIHPLEALRQHLRDRRYLLVLDNFEHVSEAAPEVVDLLGSCPNLSVLVTSRAPLRVRGEREYSVSSLVVPDPTRTPEPEEVARTPAAQLFVERAEEASPSFALTESNAASVAAICWRLDGLPLALELAAARARFLGPTALLSRLDKALEAGGGARDLPKRQQTMRATLDWSHDLLHMPEKELFRRLSVFAGGFTLEEAEDVGALGAVEAEDVLVLLGNLVEQSLVVVETTPEGRTRYRMLEPVRQYALERLRESGEVYEARRHVRYYLALVEQAEPHIKGLDQAKWLDRLETENDNLRAAIGWSIDTGDTQSASRFGWMLAMYWVMRARHSEGRLWMEQAVARNDLPDETRAKALRALAACVYGSGDDERRRSPKRVSPFPERFETPARRRICSGWAGSPRCSWAISTGRPGSSKRRYGWIGSYETIGPRPTDPSGGRAPQARRLPAGGRVRGGGPRAHGQDGRQAGRQHRALPLGAVGPRVG